MREFDPHYMHKEYPKQFARDDFWRQVKRTVNGEPVSEENIAMIVTQIDRYLELGADDRLLDLCCGNAALASHWFPKLEAYTGVDFSPYLLAVAKEYFSAGGKNVFVEMDALSFVRKCVNPEHFNKLLCYGSLSYFSPEATLSLLESLAERFNNLTHLFFGNLPDRSRASEFFARRRIAEYALDDPQSAIGVWWDPTDLCTVAEGVGFRAEAVRMPDGFYGTHYRFDLRLRRVN